MKKTSHWKSNFVLQNILIVIVFFMIGSCLAYAYAKHKQTKTYRVQRSMVIGHNLSRINYRNSAVMSDLNMMDTYTEQVKEPQVLRRVHRLLPRTTRNKYTANDLKEVLSVSNEDHSLDMTIKATTESSKYSTQIVNATAQAYKQEFSKMNNSGAEVKLLSPARQSDAVSKTTPSKKKYVKLGAALGLLIGLLIAFIRISYKKLL